MYINFFYIKIDILMQNFEKKSLIGRDIKLIQCLTNVSYICSVMIR